MKIYKTDYAHVFFGGKEDRLSDFSKKIEKPIFFGHQVHKADLIKAPQSDSYSFRASHCLTESSDGLFTTSRSLSLGLYTADCVPCVIATKDRLFSLHLGWKGIYFGLLKKALERIEKSQSLEVFIGPHIGADSFEVQSDLIEKFSTKYKDKENWLRAKNNKTYISLFDLIKSDLKDSKLKFKLFHEEKDTYTSKEHHSYRASEGTRLRNLSLSFLRT